MNEFIRKFYDSDMCEARKGIIFSDEARAEMKLRERLYEKLEENLNEDNLELLEKYLDTYSIVRDDELFHAYVSGMRDLIRFTAGIFM
ncbi:MAG: hypothetical protein K2K34_01040 [Oscillospiraceae bacterium]|nr:hypothetical protein [Oscillospiraceae bacterium]